MRIVVFGATGSTDRKVVERALASGHEVAAIVRRPQAIVPAMGLRVLRADVLDGASLVGSVEGADAVISCIGPAPRMERIRHEPKLRSLQVESIVRNFSPGTVVSQGTSNIVAACQSAGVHRFVMQSGITLSEGNELSVANRWAIRILRRIFSKACNDKAIAERVVQQSALDWVIVRPAVLREAARSPKYTAGPKARIAPLAPLSFSDCADCLIRAAIDPAWARKIINVGR